MIALAVVVGIVAVGIVGYGAWFAWDSDRPFGERSSQQIDGMENFRTSAPKSLTRKHVQGKVSYRTSPPVGGNHNPVWQNCEGDVYAAAIANEHAVHSLEHGAVWVTYRPDLPADQVKELTRKVRGKDYLMMSPYPGLDSPISLQAWGFRLAVNSADDKRVDQFLTQFRRNSAVEPGATCGQGNTRTGTEPLRADQQGELPGMPQGASQ